MVCKAASRALRLLECTDKPVCLTGNNFRFLCTQSCMSVGGCLGAAGVDVHAHARYNLTSACVADIHPIVMHITYLHDDTFPFASDFVVWWPGDIRLSFGLLPCQFNGVLLHRTSGSQRGFHVKIACVSLKYT